MIQKILEKAWEFLQHPVETFQRSKDEPLGAVIPYYLTLLVLNTVLTMIGSYGDLLSQVKRGFLTAGGEINPFAVILILGNDLFRVLFLGTAGLLIGGVVIHAGVYLAGGRKGMRKTFTALMYGATPYLVTSWITSFLSLIWFGGTIVGFICLVFIVIWTLMNIYYGVREFQEISSHRAAAAVAGPLVILSVAAVAVFMLLLFLSLTAGFTNTLELAKPPITFSLDRTNDTITLKNLGQRKVNPIQPDKISRLEVSMHGVPSGTIGTTNGSELSLVSPSCPADVDISAVYLNGTSGKIAAIKDKNCINDITRISIQKSGTTIIVRNNGGARLGEVSKLEVGVELKYPPLARVASMPKYSELGITHGSERIIPDIPASWEFNDIEISMRAYLKNNATWSWVCERGSRDC